MAMADDAAALSDMAPEPQPVVNPDAQATVNDFLDYTEFFPSDLQRSLRLIKKLDLTCGDAVQAVHELTTKYGKLPTVPANERPDPTALRRDIAITLERAIQCRESTFAEASRLSEVAERHCQRIKIIKRKLQALPQPPSRDPTPVPVSPQASRSLNRAFDRAPHLRLAFEGPGSGGRRRDRKRSGIPLSGRGRSLSSSSESDSDVRSTIDLATPRKLKRSKDKTPRPPKPRVRIPGSGTNVHSSVAGISTSNALARLSPPPPDAKPGSKWAPWFKLTEYEMAVLRKKMKKNAVWTPSETMIKRVLEEGKRGQENYDLEKQRCEALGIEMLDEEPAAPSTKVTTLPSATDAASASAFVPVTAQVTTPVQPRSSAAETTSPMELVNPHLNDVTPAPSTVTDTMTSRGEEGVGSNDTRLSKRESQRRQAKLDTQELANATKRIKGAAEQLMEMSFDPTLSTTRKTLTRSSNKRKRDSSPIPGAESPSAVTREQSLASQDSGSKPDPKRLRIVPLAGAPGSVSSPRTLTPIVPSPVGNTSLALPETTKTTSIQVPLAPAGPGTPTITSKPQSKAASGHTTPALVSPIFASAPQSLTSPGPPAPVAAPQTAVTAASTRSRRESVNPRAASPPALAQPVKVSKASTPVPEEPRPSTGQPVRPRSARGHVPTPKAQSEEPKPHEQEKATRELRRHSIFSQSTLAAPTRQSTRKKPPPKGDITAGEDGQKTVTTVKRAQGNKNKKKKRSDEDNEPQEEIDPDEPRYCICDDVSFGQMISCDNHCEKEWFHLECVGMTEKDIPSRRAKWYCPDCRSQMNTDAYGNPKIPPSLPGRRGHRFGSA